MKGLEHYRRAGVEELPGKAQQLSSFLVDNWKPLSAVVGASLLAVSSVVGIAEKTQQHIGVWTTIGVLFVVSVLVMAVISSRTNASMRKRQMLVHRVVHGARDEILKALDSGHGLAQWERPFEGMLHRVRELFREVTRDNSAECVLRLACEPASQTYSVVVATSTDGTGPIPFDSCFRDQFRADDLRGALWIDAKVFTRWCGDVSGDHRAARRSVEGYRWATVAPIVTIEKGKRYLAGYLHILSSRKRLKRIHSELLAFCADFIGLTYSQLARSVIQREESVAPAEVRHDSGLSPTEGQPS